MTIMPGAGLKNTTSVKLVAALTADADLPKLKNKYPSCITNKSFNLYKLLIVIGALLQLNIMY